MFDDITVHRGPRKFFVDLEMTPLQAFRNACNADHQKTVQGCLFS